MTLCCVASTGRWAAAQTTTQPVRAIVKKGEPAPFAGVLLTRTALTRLLADADKRVAAERIKAEAAAKAAADRLAAARSAAKAELAAEVKRTEACRGARTADKLTYERALKTCSARTSVWRSPVLWGAVGLAVGAAGCAAAAIAIGR